MWPQALFLFLVVGTAGAATVLALVAAAKGNQRRFRQAAWLVGVVASGYLLVLAGAAALARDRALPPGEEKYICELDCHLAYSVVGVQRRGDSLSVRVNVRFDGETISSRRPRDVPLYPGGRKVQLVDGSGRKYRPVSLGDLGRTLLPGESYQTDLVFDVDPTATGLVLYIIDADPTKKVLVGSDNALLRRPLGLRL